MKTVIVSPKFQIVIPHELRRQLNIQAGQKLKARIQDNHIELIPGQSITSARGFLPGLDTQVDGEKDRV